MKLSDIYQSQLLSAADLPDDGLKIRLISVGVASLKSLRMKGEEQKIVADYEASNGDGIWQPGKKQFVIGRQNAKLIAKQIGDDTDNWVGHILVLGKSMTQFGQSIIIQRID